MLFSTVLALLRPDPPVSWVSWSLAQFGLLSTPVESLPTWHWVLVHSNRVRVGVRVLTRQQFSLHVTAPGLARASGPTTSSRFVTSALFVLARLQQSLPSGSLLPTGSAMTTRLHHQLPRQDLHLLAYQRSKTAQTPSNPNLRHTNSAWPIRWITPKARSPARAPSLPT